jgi:hypothetical protein
MPERKQPVDTSGLAYVSEGDPFVTETWIAGIPAAAHNALHPLTAKALLGTPLYATGPAVPDPVEPPGTFVEPAADGPAAIPLARDLPDAPPPAEPREPEPPPNGPAARQPYWWNPAEAPAAPATVASAAPTPELTTPKEAD